MVKVQLRVGANVKRCGYLAYEGNVAVVNVYLRVGGNVKRLNNVSHSSSYWCGSTRWLFSAVAT
jgi:hypothetical protein